MANSRGTKRRLTPLERTAKKNRFNLLSVVAAEGLDLIAKLPGRKKSLPNKWLDGKVAELDNTTGLKVKPYDIQKAIRREKARRASLQQGGTSATAAETRDDTQETPTGSNVESTAVAAAEPVPRKKPGRPKGSTKQAALDHKRCVGECASAIVTEYVQYKDNIEGKALAGTLDEIIKRHATAYKVDAEKD